MRKNILLYTNIIVCAIITVGFIATSLIGYYSNTTIFEKDAEHVSTLAAEGIYYRIDKILSEPVNVSQTMANDNLLKSFLSDEENHLKSQDYTQQLGDYLKAYREKYDYDSVFLVSTLTDRYYHFNGLDRVLTPENAENIWYYDFLDNDEEYALNVDNDEAADNSITVFVNCKIKDKDGRIMGIIGVGVKVYSLQGLLKEYDEKFDVTACLVDDQGIVQLSSEKTGYEHINLFETSELQAFRSKILGNEQNQQDFWYSTEKAKKYVVSQYVPSLKWHLVTENDMTTMSRQLQRQFYKGIGIIILIIVFVLFTITNVLKQYRAQIVKLSVPQQLEYQKLLSQTTAGLYENIFEVDITHNKAGGDSLKSYSEALGISANTPYDMLLRTIAKQQIKKEYAQGYLDAFLPERVLESYNNGINNLSYDFMIRDHNGEYHWMRSVARIFYWTSDESVRMISFRQNIDKEKNRELQLLDKSQRDSLTGLYNKAVTEESISMILNADSKEERRHALLIFDIDYFKNINDRYGHAFGDTVITSFATELKIQFRDSDILGRIGGDEFAVLMRDCSNVSMLSEKLDRFCARITQKDFGQQKDSVISCSIGVALYPNHGMTYSELYEKADQALYYAKAHGKSTFHIAGSNLYDNDAGTHLDSRHLKELLDNTTDGIVKFAYTTPLKLLYFNPKLMELSGVTMEEINESNFDIFSYIHPEDLQTFQEALQKAFSEKTPIAITFRLRTANLQYCTAKFQGLFVSELYQNSFPVFYGIYTELSDVTPQGS